MGLRAFQFLMFIGSRLLAAEGWVAAEAATKTVVGVIAVAAVEVRPPAAEAACPCLMGCYYGIRSKTAAAIVTILNTTPSLYNNIELVVYT